MHNPAVCLMGCPKPLSNCKKKVEQQLPAPRVTPNWSQTQGFVVDLEYKEYWSNEDLTWSTKIPFPRLLLSVRGTSKQRPHNSETWVDNPTNLLLRHHFTTLALFAFNHTVIACDRWSLITNKLAAQMRLEFTRIGLLV